MRVLSDLKHLIMQVTEHLTFTIKIRQEMINMAIKSIMIQQRTIREVKRYVFNLLIIVLRRLHL